MKNMFLAVSLGMILKLWDMLKSLFEIVWNIIDLFKKKDNDHEE